MKCFSTVAAVSLMAAAAQAQVDNLRITEIDPANDQVEVTNLGPAFTSAATYPFCHRFSYGSNIPAGTSFGAGEAKVFTVAGLNDTDSDLWLYRATPFGDPNNIVHGVKFGPAADVGRSGIAATVGLWPSASAFVPAPGAGQTISFDGFGNAPADWYVDDSPSMGQADPVAFGTVLGSLGVPEGFERFESVPLGDQAVALTNWVIVDGGTVDGDFDVRVIADVDGQSAPLPSPGSTRWLRIRDQDGSAAQNRFYSGFLSTGGVTLPYTMTFYINPIELPATSAANKPRFTVQHRFNGGVTNTWGIELDNSGASLVVLANGGPAANLPLGSLATGAWTKVTLEVDFVAGTVGAALGNASQTTTPIGPAAGVDPTELRFCYRGEGTGNVATMLVDDLGFRFGVAASEMVRPGTPANPNVLLPGQTSGPVIGQTWDPVITPFVSGPILDFLVVTPRTTFNAPSAQAIGTQLIDLQDPWLRYYIARPGVPFSVSVPNVLGLIGLEFSTQGLSIGAQSIELTNGLDIVLGR